MDGTGAIKQADFGGLCLHVWYKRSAKNEDICWHSLAGRGYLLLGSLLFHIILCGMSFNALDLKKTSLCDFKVKNCDVIFKFISQQRSIQNIRVDYRSIMCEMLECFCIEHCLSILIDIYCLSKRQVDQWVWTFWSFFIVWRSHCWHGEKNVADQLMGFKMQILHEQGFYWVTSTEICTYSGHGKHCYNWLGLH